MAIAVVLVLACKGEGEAAPDPKPSIELAAVGADALCVTKGELAPGTTGAPRVAVPTFRAVARGGGGDAAALAFVASGKSAKTRALASGQLRRQVGLKLRAENSCNVVYVMWRLDPKPQLEVSVKRNAGKRTHKDCGAAGYTKVKGDRKRAVPALDYGTRHVLQAEITGDELVAWIDGRVAWRGELPADARDVRGPAGVRSDNLELELASFSADKRTAIDPKAKCAASGDDDDAE